MQDSLEVNALGHPVSSDSSTTVETGSSSLGSSSFAQPLSSPVRAAAKSTKSSILEVKNFSDRAATLDVLASLSLSILCAMVTVNGTTSDRSASQDATESATLAVLVDNASITTEKALELNATHIVTSITYGSNVVATLMPKSSLKEKESKVSSGKLSLGIPKSMASLVM
ncbi:hypothetical protein DFH07DRAFT_956408 [Mycena maculata]|uniref:Uncharacterized protein n=1 Tax=Mycena maculata TaxID=230809 RepID=A0AAD7JIR4_9AGAR|nr:hypothetical protein DFH07DRAFT_956408 [Mycena maculata]